MAALLVVLFRAVPAAAQNDAARAQASAPASAPHNAGANAPADAVPVKPEAPKDKTIYHLLGFSLSGTKQVDTAALVAKLPQHEGDAITRDEINDDADHIRAALKAAHVHGDMTTAFLEREGKGHHIWVIWDVQLTDALSYVPLRGKRFFASQSFAGNVKLSTDALVAATGLHPGDPMPDGRLSSARTAIEQRYDAALHGAPVAVKGKVKLRKDDTVVINWQITEPN